MQMIRRNMTEQVTHYHEVSFYDAVPPTSITPAIFYNWHQSYAVLFICRGVRDATTSGC